MASQPPGEYFELEFLKKLFNKVTIYKDVCKAEGTNKNFDTCKDYLKLEGTSTLFRHKEGSPIKSWRLEKGGSQREKEFLERIPRNDQYISAFLSSGCVVACSATHSPKANGSQRQETAGDAANRGQYNPQWSVSMGTKQDRG